MKKKLFTILIPILFLWGMTTAQAQPVIDGSFDGTEVWGEAVGTNPSAGWNSSDAKELYVTSSDTHIFFGALVTARRWNNAAFVINTGAPGSSTDPWGRNVVYNHAEAPNLHIKIALDGNSGNGYAETRSWNGSSWVQGTNLTYAQNFNAGVSDNDLQADRWIEARIPRALIGDVDEIDVQFLILGNNSVNGNFNSIPADNQQTDWGQQTTASNYVLAIDVSADGPAPEPDKRDITFRVDMTAQVQNGNFDPTVHKVFVSGTFNGWNATGNEMDLESGNIYATTLVDFEGDEGNSLFYKFLFDTTPDATWENDPNRELILGPDGEAQVIPTVFFNNVEPIAVRSVVFRVDMSFQIAAGNFDPENDVISVAGTFTDPGWIQLPMFQVFDNPNLYRLTIDVTGAEGTEIEYKFVLNGDFELPGPDNNRTVNLGPGNELQLLPIVRYNDEYGVVIDGRQGWRSLGIPANISAASFLNPIWTQGVPGSDFPGSEAAPAQASVIGWNPETQAWVPAPTLEQNSVPGLGLAVYVYDRNTFGVPESAVWPKVLSLQAPEFEAPVTMDLISPLPSHLALLANPFFEAISWNAVTKSANILPEAIWIMDSSLGIEGDWATYLDLPAGGVIAPFQGFIIQNDLTIGPREVVFTEASKTSNAATFFNAPQVDALVRLQLNHEDFQTGTWIRISEEGSLQRSIRDAILLGPMNANYMVVGSVKEDGTAMSIGTFPSQEQHVEFPLFLETTESGQFSFTVSSFDVVSDWNLQLVDTWTGTSVQITPDLEYTFEFEANAAVALNEQNLPRNPGAVIKNEGSPRFVVIASTATTSVPTHELPQFVALNQNYPNPFNPTTQISYDLPASAEVRLEVFNIQGQRVATLVNAAQTAGTHTVTFDASNLASGVYLYRLQVGTQVLTKKMTLVK